MRRVAGSSSGGREGVGSEAQVVIIYEEPALCLPGIFGAGRACPATATAAAAFGLLRAAAAWPPAGAGGVQQAHILRPVPTAAGGAAGPALALPPLAVLRALARCA